MSRTHTIDHSLTTNTFQVPVPGLPSNAPLETHMSTRMLQAVERAKLLPGYDATQPLTPFIFDLIEFTRAITTDRLKADVINRLSWSIDGYITGGLSSILADIYKHSKTEECELSFATYGDFLHYVEGLTHAEECIYEAGCDVRPKVERMRNLFAFRAQLHALAAMQLRDPSTYVEPDIRTQMLDPTLRTVSAAEEQGYLDIANDDAEDNEALRDELLAQYKLSAQIDKLNEHRMAKIKGKALVTLLACIKADQSAADVTEEDDAFFDMDARTQRGLLNSMHRSITETRRKAVVDSRIPVMEKAKLRVEAKDLLKTLTETLEHRVFADLDD